MKLPRKTLLLTLLMFLLVILMSIYPNFEKATAQSTPLPSWNDGSAKQAIIEFVQATTDKSSTEYVNPDDRIITFDQDGRLWVEHPLYTQAIFALDRVKSLAPTSQMANPRAVSSDSWGRSRSDLQIHRGGLGTNHRRYPRRHDYRGIHQNCQRLAGNGKASHFQQPYTELVYQTMLEVM